MSNNIILYGPKLLKMASSYITVNICANYMSQIYMDKVLINQENPPKLENFVSMFVVLDLLMMIIIGVIAYLVMPLLIPSGNKNSNITTLMIMDYAICLAFISIVGLIVANVMYNKKYFMYKDDGLRAIRALKDIMLQISIFFSIVPFFMFKIM